MSGGYFPVIDSVKKAYGLVGQHAVFLAAAAAVPLAVKLVTEFWFYYLGMDRGSLPGPIEACLWRLPQNLCIGWLVFVQARMILFGEMPGRLPAGGDAAARQQWMRASVILFLLFDMMMALFNYIFLTTYQMNVEKQNTWAMALTMLAVGAFFWALRLAVMPVVAAAGFSLRRFIFKVNGVEFSLRLIGVTVMAALPIAGAMMITLSMILPPDKTEPSQGAAIASIALTVPFSLLMTSVIYAAATFGISGMLRQKEGDKA